MVEFKVPADVSVKDFFLNYVPKQFNEIVAGADLSAMAGKEFTLQFNIDGQKYCMKIKDGKGLEVIEGGVDKPMLALTLSEKDWRDSITGRVPNAMDQFTDPTQAADITRYEALQRTKGALHLELKKDDGGVLPVTITFNGESSPVVTLKLMMADWIAMQKKETDGQTLFMSGKMNFDGDMVFLMALQSLV